METSFADLKKKDVVNVRNGKKMGKICNILFCWPEGRITGFVVPDGKGFFVRSEIFIPVGCIVKIGADVILAEVNLSSEPPSERMGIKPPDRRSYEEYE